ncbi:MAG TPA: carboxypeptidase-like regulatory domain-containing protein [Puia sp.]|nr:carboxypeptidase-like regulatory domain-containing protein [Puia sp.]
MKKILSFLLLALLTVSRLSAQSPVSTLTGSVRDSATGKPLAGVSVFLNSTSKGTVTHDDGTFTLGGIPTGRYELIVSAIGYSTRLLEISTRHLPAFLKILLNTRASELAAVTVEPYLKDGWKRYGKFFWDNFIGTTDNASSCTIKNKDVLRFRFYPKSRKLSVTAVEPLIVVNKALGYNLEYRLEGFTCDYSSNIISYFGYPLFHEMIADNSDRQQRWEKNRQLAYLGSMMHFMRSLYSGRLHEDGFIVEHEVEVPNIEKARVKAIFIPNVTKTDSIPIDSLHHYWAILREPDYFIQKVKNYDNLVTANADQTKSFYFTGDFSVIFGIGHLGIPYTESSMEMMVPAPVEIEENGMYFPPGTLLSKGNWARTEKIANLVPRDYTPPPLP